jgi:hypothetical protein
VFSSALQSVLSGRCLGLAASSLLKHTRGQPLNLRSKPCVRTGAPTASVTLQYARSTAPRHGCVTLHFFRGFLITVCPAERVVGSILPCAWRPLEENELQGKREGVGVSLMAYQGR